ncbi:MAG: glycosyltransferase [Caulobacteraceae bacterium]|nr:glycosyltransferase [Caulobacteraceae bacterium]
MALKIVLSTAGTAGDLNPFVALALELKARGHQPSIAAQREFQSTVEGEGLGFHPLRPGIDDIRDELGLDARQIVQRAARGSTGLEFLIRRIAMPFLRRSYDDMMRASAGADMLVTHTSVFAARLAAEKRGMPWISTALSPFTFMSSFDPPPLSARPLLLRLREMTGARSDAALLQLIKMASGLWTLKVARLRDELGLPRMANPLFEGQFSPYGTIALYSPRFAAAQPDFPSPCTITGFCIHDRQHGAAAVLSQPLTDFLRSGPEPIVFTLGSALVMDSGDFYETSLTAARRLGRRSVLLVGPDSDRIRAKISPAEDVFIADYAPHSVLFPHAAAIVQHGGIGTTAQGMRAGKPQLVVPFTADQPDNARRAAELGVARVLPAGAYTRAAAVRELGALLQDKTAARTAELAALLAQENGPAKAADTIEAAFRMARQPLRA